METRATGGAQSKTVWEGKGNPVQDTCGGAAIGLHIYKAEPGAAMLDKLLPNRQHEGMGEE